MLVLLNGGRTRAPRLEDRWPTVNAYCARRNVVWTDDAPAAVAFEIAVIRVFLWQLFDTLDARAYRDPPQHRLDAAYVLVTKPTPLRLGGWHDFALRSDVATLRLALDHVGAGPGSVAQLTLEPLYRTVWIAASPAALL